MEEEEETQKVGVSEFDPNGSFARVMASSLAEKRPDMTVDQVEAEVRHRWGLWMENQQPNKHPSKSSGQVEKEVTLEDFGFARPLGGFLVVDFLWGNLLRLGQWDSVSFRDIEN